MLTYIVLAIVAAGLLVTFVLVARALNEEEAKGCGKKCPKLLTMNTPVTLSEDEVAAAGLKKTIHDRVPDALAVDVDGVSCVQMNIPEFLDVLLQKCSQHEKEIGDIVAVLPKKKRATRKKK